VQKIMTDLWKNRKMKWVYVSLSLVLVCLATSLYCLELYGQRNVIEGTWRQFADAISSGNWDRAQTFLYKASSSNDVAQSPDKEMFYSGDHFAAAKHSGVQIVYVRMGLLGREAEAVITQASFVVPVRFEDGFSAVCVRFVRENGGEWRIRSPPTSMGR
jgi:hypothetical protein